MIQHVVMFWMKDKDEKKMRETVDLLNSMRGKVPGLVSLNAGMDVVRSPRSCDICLSTVFKTREDLEVYRTHPVHLPVQAHMHAVMEKSQSADFEIERL